LAAHKTTATTVVNWERHLVLSLSACDSGLKLIKAQGLDHGENEECESAHHGYSMRHINVHQRIHSAIGYRTPIEYESDCHQNHAQEILSA
jgi:hypothetical protein